MHKKIAFSLAEIIGSLSFILILSGSLFPNGVKNSQKLPDFSVVGIVMSSDGLNSAALIKVGQNAEVKVLKIGEDLCGWRVIGISRAGISIQDGKQTLRIGLTSQGAEKSGAGKAPTPDIAPPSPEPLRVVLDKKMIQSTFRAEWPIILKEAYCEPRLVDGKVRGYRLAKFPRRGLLWETGLLPGDVLLSIDSVQMNENVSPLAILQLLRTRDDFDVVIERNGKIMSLHFELRS